MITELKEFWSRYTPYKLHPDDEHYLSINKPKYCLEVSIEELRNKYGNNLKLKKVKESFISNKFNRNKIIPNIFAIPFLGDVENARVYILMGNPGFDTGDYVDEIENENYIKLLKNNLDFKSKNFFCIDSMAFGTGGEKYWSQNGRMLKILKYLNSKNNLTSQDNYSFIKKSVCIIQSVAYHSCEKPNNKLYNLPSSRFNKRLVNEYVQNKINNKKSLCFVYRSASFWNMQDNGNLIVRSPKNARHQYLTENEADSIADFLNSMI